MRVIRLGLPAIVGCLFILFGFQTIATGGQSGEPGELAAQLHIAVLPSAIGIVLLLAAVATARRTRLGFWLGLTAGVLMALAGLAAIVAEIPFLQRGGLSASLGGGVIVLAIVWTVLWLAYSWRFSKAKLDFAPAWVPADRRLGVVLSIVFVIAAAIFLGTGALEATAVANAIESDAQARAVVEATSFEVRARESTISPAAAASPASVSALTVEVELRSEQPYAFQVGDDSVPPPPSGTPTASEGCLGVSP